MIKEVGDEWAGDSVIEEVADDEYEERQCRARVLIVYDLGEHGRREAIGVLAVTEERTAGELARTVESGRIGMHRRQGGRMIVEWVGENTKIFHPISGYPHDGFTHRSLPGSNLRDIGERTKPTYVYVTAEPGRHVYNAGPEAESLLHDARDAQEVRWNRVAPTTPSPFHAWARQEC